MKSNALVQKIWSFCHTLRDDGLAYGDYLEQLTYLLFLKLANESSADKNFSAPSLPPGLDWSSLVDVPADQIQIRYQSILTSLSSRPGTLGAIFIGARNRIQDPRKLNRLIRLIDSEQWRNFEADTKGDLYEGLLQKNAEDTKSGAGQYFTPRPIIEAIMACVRPQPMKSIADPACGTGGFFLGAQNWLQRNNPDMSECELEFLQRKTFFGNEIVAGTRRLCLMNLFLHGIGGLDGEPDIELADALIKSPHRKADYVFANPPFGKRSSMTAVTMDGASADSLEYQRNDFWEKTSNKQLNFLQHITTLMADNGKAAVVLPDNVLFESGVGERIRRRLLRDFDVHTLLRLPTGIFYAQGISANVLFFDALPQAAVSSKSAVWVYDLRTDGNYTLKTRPIQEEDLRDFVDCYRADDVSARLESERFRSFDVDEILSTQGASLDISWAPPGPRSSNSHEIGLEQLNSEIIGHLEDALEAFRRMSTEISKGM